MQRCMSPLLALSGHTELHCTCPLSGTKRTSPSALHMSAFDPKRTLAFLNAMLDQPALVEMPFMARR